MDIKKIVFEILLKRLKPINFLIILQLFLIDFKRPNYLFASEIYKPPSTEYLDNVPSNNFYILGPGDSLFLKVTEKSSLLDSNFTIDGEGVALLPRLENVYLSGLTIGELTEILNKAYKKFVIQPEVKISITSYRPVKVIIEGEVVNPGVYNLAGSGSPLNLIDELKSQTGPTIKDNKDSKISDNIFFPSLVDIIRTSGGLTENADLTKIKVVRSNPISKGGGRIKTTVNLMQTLNGFDPSQNLRILDGDNIIIGYSEEPIVAQLRKTIKANLNPKFINVFVGGRVEDSGLIKINNSAVLTDAIYLAGGTKVLKGPVRFLRYNSDGSIDNRVFSFKRRAKRGSYKNPYLREGDVVMVGKSKLNLTNEILSEITAPIQGIVSTYGFYKLITD